MCAITRNVTAVDEIEMSPGYRGSNAPLCFGVFSVVLNVGVGDEL